MIRRLRKLTTTRPEWQKGHRHMKQYSEQDDKSHSDEQSEESSCPDWSQREHAQQIKDGYKQMLGEIDYQLGNAL